jgi:hypothetical protein
MTWSRHPHGRVESDERLHAIKRGLLGHIALCGAGPAVVILAGRFDPDAEAACGACADAARRS